VSARHAKTDTTRADHVVAVQGGAFRCLHCKAEQPMALPCDFDVYLAASRVFLRKHRDCHPVESA
jgi:hypothetical protein